MSSFGIHNVGGDIIMKVQGIPVTDLSSYEKIRAAMMRLAGGGTVTVTIFRSGQVLDLTGKLPAPSIEVRREVRIVTNMRIYWDQILVDTSGGSAPVEMTRMNPATADLHWRGFSAEVSPDGREPFSYAYDRVSLNSPWKVMPGRYTREGDVRELLMRSDDMFVISRPGDEISLSFDATKLRPIPKGWRRTFLLYADGFSKEMDINSASPDLVMPLPFHAMKGYPYSEGETYPMTRSHRAYLERYNTRLVRSPVPSIDLAGAR